MKFTVNSTELLKALLPAKKIINPNPIVPILENFRFSKIDEELQIVSSNLNSLVESKCQVSGGDGLNFCIDSSLLVNTLLLSPNSPCEFTYIKEENRVTLKIGKSEYNFSVENYSDFPFVKQGIYNDVFTLKTDLFCSNIKNSLNHSKNDDVTEKMNGILIESVDDKIVFVGCDGYSIRINKIDNTGMNGSVYIFHKTAKAIFDTFSSENGFVEVSTSKSSIKITNGFITMWSTLKENVFVDYKGLPQIGSDFIKINKEDFLISIKRSLSFGDEINEKTARGITLSVFNGNFSISAKNSAYEISAIHEIEIIDTNIDNIKFSTNANKLLSAINEIVESDFLMEFNENFLFIKENNLVITTMKIAEL